MRVPVTFSFLFLGVRPGAGIEETWKNERLSHAQAVQQQLVYVISTTASEEVEGFNER